MTGYPTDVKPFIKWKHIDGPVLCLRNGEMHWLTLWDRLRVWLRLDDARSLERKYWNERGSWPL